MSETFRYPKGAMQFECALRVMRQKSAKHKIKVVIQMDRADRSDEQNAALFGVAYKALSEHTGYRKEELHDIFMRMFFGEVESEIMGKRYSRPRRTTTTNENGERDVISKLLFAELYEFIQIVAAEKLSCQVPDPDPHWRQNLEIA